MYNIQVQPEQKQLYYPLVTKQEMCKFVGYLREIQTKILITKWPTITFQPPFYTKKGIMQTHLKCIQLNLQYSRLTTNNLWKIIEEENTDIIFI